MRRPFVLAAEFAACLALAVTVTWPLAARGGNSLPLGGESVATVPLLNVWTVWWNADRLRSGLASYWDAPIFHPARGAFAFSEAQPVTGIVAPVTWLGGPVLAYNVYLLASLALNGWTTLALLRRLDVGPWAARGGAALMIVLPFVHWQSGVLQLVPLWGVLWTVLELQRLGMKDEGSGMSDESVSARSAARETSPTSTHSGSFIAHLSSLIPHRSSFIAGLRLGVAFGVTYLACNHYGLFLSVLLTVSGAWLLGRRLRERKAWAALALAAGVAATLTAPVVAVQWAAIVRDHGWRRESPLVLTLSAAARDYATPVVRRWPWLPTLADPERAQTWRLSPGAGCGVLAAAGALWGLRRPGRRGWTAFCVSLVAAAFVLSLGARVSVGGHALYDGLVAVWPGFAQVRSPFRFAVFVQLGTVLLAGAGIQAVHDLVSKVCRRRSVCVLAALVPGAAGLYENWPAPARLYDVPRASAPEHWALWLREHTPPESVLACLPLPTDSTVEDYLSETLWMRWQILHQRPIVNGYSGFFPAEYWQLRDDLREFPSDTSLDQLEAHDVTHCVIDGAALSPDQWDTLGSFEDRLKRLYFDEPRGVAVYELLRHAP